MVKSFVESLSVLKARHIMDISEFLKYVEECDRISIEKPKEYSHFASILLLFYMCPMGLHKKCVLADIFNVNSIYFTD